MKTTFAAILGFAFIASAQAASAPCKRAACLPENIEISLVGREMAPRQEDYDAVRNAIGSLVSDIKLKKYVFRAWGTEGGFSACLESMDSDAYSVMMQRLATIQVDTARTTYDIKHVESCGN